MKQALLAILVVGLCTLTSACTNTAGVNADQFRQQLSDHPTRAQEDKDRDAGRKPADVIAFLGIGPGMKVIDVIAAGGYYSEVLAHAVGSEGHVYSQFPTFFGNRFEQPFKDKFGDRLPQVEYLAKDLDALGIEANSLDAAITALNLHDVYNRDPTAGLDFMKSVYAVLKPGGVFGVIDHAGSKDGDNAANHRMTEEDAVALAEQAGFIVEARSDLLRNPADNKNASIRDVERGYTDRFLLKLRKPK